MSATPVTFDKKRTVILLRSVVVVSTSYLILFGGNGLSFPSIVYILALILSNIALVLSPRDWFHEPKFSAALLLADTAVVLIGLYLTVGCFSQDFLIIYFFTIFLTTATSSIAQIATGAAMISGLYGYWLWLTSAHVLGPGEWLRLPFFFIVAVFYAYVTEETKQERYRREQAERENEHLRFLLQLEDAFSQRAAAKEMVDHVGSLVEAAFPRLRCAVHSEPILEASHGTVFLLHSHDRTYGALQVGTHDGSALGPEENQFCKVVAMVVANALYAAEQMRAAQDGTRLKEEFLATLSHELRSPLHSILGNADIIAETLQHAPDAFTRESIDRLRASACHLLHLVEEMLCFAELRAGKGALVLEPVDLRELFEQFRFLMTNQLAGRPLRFECTVAADVPQLFTDRRKLQLIVNALLSNASKFTQQGLIRLSAQRAGEDAAEIVVQDTGIGLDPNNIAPIFQEFRQLDGSLKRRFEGIGLGLALAQELAIALGGRVEVESQPNRGSTFRVRVPLDSRATSAPKFVVPALGWQAAS